MKKSIPFYEYPRAYTDDKKEVLKIIDNVASKGAFIMQKELTDFEYNISKFTGAKHCLGVANATDALEIAWSMIGLKKGDEVIISAHTMLATASAIKVSGGEPIPVDIGLDGLIDPVSIENAITDRTVAICPTQLNGRTCNMDIIQEIANKYGLLIVEDAAQGLGSTFRGKSAGTFGFASCISFYPAKILGSLGDGGLLITDSVKYFDTAKRLRDHGRDEITGDVKEWGRNSRLDNIQAAVLDFRLSKYDEVIRRRREIASIYDQYLSNIKELILPPPPSDGDHFDVYQNYEMQAENRDDLKLFLKEHGIGTLVQWGGMAIHHFKQLGFQQNLPNADSFFEKCIMLPMNNFISDNDVHYIIEVIVKFYSKK